MPNGTSTRASADGNRPQESSSRAAAGSDHFSYATKDVDAAAGQDFEYDADVEVVRPYEVEEPADQGTGEFSMPWTRKLLQDSDFYWQHELVHSMQQLQCDSDNGDSLMSPGGKRGRKRKPSGIAGGSAHSSWNPFNSESLPSSSKRRRRRSKPFREDSDLNKTSSLLYAMSDSSPCTTPGSEPRSVTDASDTEPTCDANTADRMEMDGEMDID